MAKANRRLFSVFFHSLHGAENNNDRRPEAQRIIDEWFMRPTSASVCGVSPLHDRVIEGMVFDER